MYCYSSCRSPWKEESEKPSLSYPYALLSLFPAFRKTSWKPESSITFVLTFLIHLPDYFRPGPTPGGARIKVKHWE